MPVVSPPSVTALPTPPSTASPTTFDTRADAFLGALPTFQTQNNALAANVFANATDAATSATTAAAQVTLATNQATAAASAASMAGATLWVSGTTYALGDARYSPTNLQTYRRKTAGAGTTDPSLDGTNWQQINGSFGLGGTTLTGSVTLTVSSAAAMSVTPATPGLFATLPVATTVTRATAPFAIYNNGNFDYGVKNSAGTHLGWVRPRTGAVIGLADNTTAAGTWATFGLEKLGITAQYVSATAANTSARLVRVALDANRTCFLFGGTSCYAIVYDASTQTWGNPTLVRASLASSAFIGVLSATNQVLVCSNDSTTGMQTVTLTISGTGVTVNTPVSTTLAGNWAEYGQLIPVSTSWVLSYGRATTTSAIRAITVSGTVPTIGAESALAPATTTPAILFASGSIVRTVALVNGASGLSCAPYTVAGSTLTVGTAASATTTTIAIRAFLNGNGNIVCQYINNTHFATIFKLTGTAEAASSVSLGTVPLTIVSNSDYVQVTASKTAFFSGASGATAVNILTDTAGTATAGTEVTGTAAGIPTFCKLPSTGNNASFSVNESNGIYSTKTFDCSGASPVAGSIFRTRVPVSGYIAEPQSTDRYGFLAASSLTVGNMLYSIGNATNAAAINATLFDYRPSQPPLFGSLQAVQETGAIGYATATTSGTVGFLIQKVEAAA